MKIRAAFGLALVVAAFSTAAEAQLASLLRDIQTSEQGGSSYPQFLGSTDGWTYFSADSSTIGRELWRTDGTTEGTAWVGDDCPGTCSTFYSALASTPGTLFLAGSPYSFPGISTELLAAKGAPPEVVSILTAGESFSLASLAYPGATALLEGRLLFWAVASAGSTPNLFSTNATATGYELLQAFPVSNGLFGMRRVGPKVLFWNQPILSTFELWSSDGTAPGTRRVATLEVEPQGQSIVLGDQVMVFAARDTNGVEIWSTDGSEQGTRRLTALADPNAQVWSMAASATEAFFYVEDVTLGQELWTSDGSTAGTHPVTAFGFHAPFGGEYLTTHLAVAGSRAYFLATDGIAGVQLWSASSSYGSASALIGVCADSYCFHDAWVASIGTQSFFVREEFDTGREVWTSDGTEAGTRILRDACPGPCYGGGTVLSSSDGKLVYGAANTESYQPTVFVATAPWSGSDSLYDSVRGAPLLDPYNPPSCIVDASRIYFEARDSLGGLEPWVSSGDPSNSFVLADIAGAYDNGSAVGRFVALGGTVAFIAQGYDPYNTNFWLTEGTAETTRPTTASEYTCSTSDSPIYPLVDRFAAVGCGAQIQIIDPASSQVDVIYTENCDYSLGSGSVGGTLAAVLRCADGSQVWRSDGTDAGTMLTLALDTGFNVTTAFERVGNRLLLVGGTSTSRLWALSSNMSNLTPISAPGVIPDYRITPAGEPLGFFGHAGRLWRTDGTPAGTFSIGSAEDNLTLQAAVRSPSGYDLLVLSDPTSEEIWSTDGTTQGTVVRARIPIPVGTDGVLPLVRAGSRLYFVLHSYYPWSASLWVLDDGSTAPLQLHSAPADELSHLGDRLYFSACDAAHGCELWTSDGTTEGTALVQDIAPGIASSYPSGLYAAGTVLYFAADDNLHGYEAWTLALDGGPECRPNTHTLCLESGRFQVSSRWRDFAGNSGDATAVPISGDTGYFWFFDDANVEMILKLIDGTGYNGHHWVYYGALSNVEYTFTVTDSETGAAKRYFNPAARFASSGDIHAFGPQGAQASGGSAEAMTRAATPPEVSLAAFAGPQELPGACLPSAARFCILNNRFSVEATWRDFAGHTGTANTGTLTDDTGYLWFFNEANVEVVLKMVDARGFNNHFWVYYGALSNVEYTLTVTDTVAGGSARVYHNALGQFGSFGDIEAFPAP